MTVLELVKKYISQKTGVRHNTEANYNFVINISKKETFGNKRIDKVKLSEAKGWLIKLQSDGRGYSTIHTIRDVVIWQGVPIVWATQFYRREAAFLLRELCITDLTEKLPFGTVILVEERLGAQQRGKMQLTVMSHSERRLTGRIFLA